MPEEYTLEKLYQKRLSISPEAVLFFLFATILIVSVLVIFLKSLFLVPFIMCVIVTAFIGYKLYIIWSAHKLAKPRVRYLESIFPIQSKLTKEQQTLLLLDFNFIYENKRGVEEVGKRLNKKVNLHGVMYDIYRKVSTNTLL